MTNLFFDIETIPAPEELEPVVRELYEKNPARPQSFEDYLRGTSLNGTLGQLFCISYAINDAPAEVLHGTEAKQLQIFWQLATSADLLIGHSIVDFDLPFLFKRSVIHRVKPSVQVGGEPIAGQKQLTTYDTKHAWDDWRGGVASGLDTLAKVFGYQTSKQGISGAQVYDFWKEGRFEEIYQYCQRDVELTRKIYRRLTFQDELSA